MDLDFDYGRCYGASPVNDLFIECSTPWLTPSSSSSSFESEELFGSETLQSSASYEDLNLMIESMFHELTPLDPTVCDEAFVSIMPQYSPPSEPLVATPCSSPPSQTSFELNSGASVQSPPLKAFVSEGYACTYPAEFNNVRLVHLLLGGAEAIGRGDKDLANVILERVQQLSSASGTTMQRIAAYFAEALQCKLSQGVKLVDKPAVYQEFDTLRALQVLHELCPYAKFGHFTANQCILEAVEMEQRIHIVDYDVGDGVQWSSLIQALSMRKSEPPRLRITALYRPGARGSLSTVQETGKMLSEYAQQHKIPFSFHQVKLENEQSPRIKLFKDESLIVNCMLHLPHSSHGTQQEALSFLQTMHRFRPKLVTIVEEQLSYESTTFVRHFQEALYHYSSFFDSLEETLELESSMVSLVERVFLGPRIKSVVTSQVSQALLNNEEVVNNIEYVPDENVGNRWSSVARDVGFDLVPFSSYNMCQARFLLGL